VVLSNYNSPPEQESLAAPIAADPDLVLKRLNLPESYCCKPLAYFLELVSEVISLRSSLAWFNPPFS